MNNAGPFFSYLRPALLYYPGLHHFPGGENEERLAAVHSFVIQELENCCHLPPNSSCGGVMERLWPQCLTPWLGDTLVIAPLILEITQMKSPWFSVRSLLLSAAELSGFSYSWSDVPCSCSAERTEASVSAGSCLFFFSIVWVGGAAFLWLSGCSPSLPPSLSLSRSLTVPLSLSGFSKLEYSACLGAVASGALRRAAYFSFFIFLLVVCFEPLLLLLLRCVAPCRAVPCRVEKGTHLQQSGRCLLYFSPPPTSFRATFKMTEEKGVRHVKLVGVWKPPSSSSSSSSAHQRCLALVRPLPPAVCGSARRHAGGWERQRRPGLEKRRDPAVIFSTILWGSSWCVCVLSCVDQNSTSEVRHLKTLGALRVDM